MRRWVVAVLALAAIAASPAAGTPEQTPKRGGTVVFGPVGESACLNPLREACGIGPQYLWMLQKVLPPAFAIAPDFTQRPILVSKVDFSKRPPFTLTYHIRPEARWSDGVPVTSQDFLFTHRAILAQLPAAATSQGLVKSIRVLDSKTFRAILRVRTAEWRQLFLTVLPQHALAGQDLAKIWTDRIDNPKTSRPIGSGPFLVERFERGKQLTLVRNPRYWGPHTAYLDRLIIRFCQNCVAPTPAEVLESLRTGAVDIAYARDTVNVPDLRNIPDTTVRLHRTDGWEHLTLRLGAGGHPALKSKLVRQAIAYGIDREEIVQRLWRELDPTYRPLHSAVLLGTARHYNPNWDGYKYRPGVARSLLERAGCRRGADGIYSCRGERLSFRFSTFLGVSQRVRGLELMQAQLRRVGIEVVLSYAAGSAFFTDILFPGQFDAVSFAFIRVTGFSPKSIYGCGAGSNYTGYCQRLVTADLDQSDRILDDAQRARVLNRVDRQLAKDVPLIPLYQIPWVLAYKDTVRNVVSSPDNLFWNAENWWLAEPR